jgi:hypothetical protein
MHKIIFSLILSVSCLLQLGLAERVFASEEISAEKENSITSQNLRINAKAYVEGLCAFYEREPEAKSFSYAFEVNYHELEAMAERLDLQLSALETFADPLVIKHRPLNSDKLLLGCGKCPDMIGAQTHPWPEEKLNASRLAHQHLGFDTIDANFARDPNYVMNFGGHSDIESIFKGRKYEEIYFEGGPEFRPGLLTHEGGTPLYLKENILQILVPHGRIYEGHESEFSLRLIRDGDDFIKPTPENL